MVQTTLSKPTRVCKAPLCIRDLYLLSLGLFLRPLILLTFILAFFSFTI